MGSHPYFYVTPYQSDLQVALQALREQEFAAGRYDPAMNQHDPNLWMFLFEFPPTEDSIAPGAKHDSIEAAIADAENSGTGSILDIQTVSDSPDFLTASPVSDSDLLAIFGTVQPGRSQVESAILQNENLNPHQAEALDELFDTISRGECRYIILYNQDQPSEIVWMGYSVD